MSHRTSCVPGVIQGQAGRDSDSMILSSLVLTPDRGLSMFFLFESHLQDSTFVLPVAY